MSSSSSHPSSSGSGSSGSSVTVAEGGRGISLSRRAQTVFNLGTTTGFRFTVEAHDALGMPNEIFRYERHPFNPRTGEAADSFDGICSPPDLEDYPPFEPSAASLPTYFRLATIDLVFRSQALAEDAWTAIQEEVAALVTTLNIMDDLGPAETSRLGDPAA